MPRGVKKAKAKPQKAKKTQKKQDKTQEIAVRRGASVNEESKALFLDHHLPQISRLKDAAHRAQSNLRNGYKAAKKDGFLQRDFDVAFRLRTQTGEQQIKAQIARDGTIAKWLGYKLGSQLDLFLKDDEDDSIEMQAYSDGEEASRSNKPASPIYAPGSPGYEAYMEGYNGHQAVLTEGIKKLDEPPSSGVVMTRSQFKAQQRAKAQADAAEERSLFKKRSSEPAA